MTTNSFGARGQLSVDDKTYEIHRIDQIDQIEGAGRLPYSLKILLENLLRNEDGRLVTAEHIAALAGWDADSKANSEIQYTPARVLMQDFTGVPCVGELGMGVLPLQFRDGESAESHGLTGEESYSIVGIAGADPLPQEVTVSVDDGERSPEISALVRIDTPAEEAYFIHGGILPYVLRQLLSS